MPNACRLCGVILDQTGRLYCEDCLPAFEAGRTRKLAHAGTAALRRMRQSADDPARSDAARAKRTEKAREMSLAARAWEREHGRVRDPEFYAREVLPKIQLMSVRALAQLTGLSDYYIRQVRKGEKRLHPRFWERIASKS